MPGWMCGRCTFVNHELMTNCEMCDAPKEAAEIPHLGDQEETNRPNDSTTQSRAESTDENVPMDQQTTQGPTADDMLDVRSEMSIRDESHLQHNQQPDISPGHSFNDTGMEVNSPEEATPPEQQSSHTEVVNGTQEHPRLPEPLAPVVLHSLETQEPLESPMSEPEQVDEAMCMPSPDKAMVDEENGWSFLDNEVRLVLIGKTGVGKSTTGNNILGKTTFKSSASGASVTKKCQLGWASRSNRDIQIIDTPGLFDTGMSNEDISREIVKCIGMTSPGPHAFILIIRLDRFTAEEKATVDHFISIFGKDMTKYLIVLFTRMDDLKFDGTTLDEYVQNVPPDLKNLLEVCQHRHIGFDNRGTQEERDKDVQDLLMMVDNMVKGNGGGHYTNEMYEEAERIIAEQEEEHMKRNREAMRREMARLREEVEEELRRKDEEKQRNLETMKGQLSELGINEEDEEWVQVLSMSPVRETDEPLRSHVTPVDQSKDTDGASEHTASTSEVMVNGSVPPVAERQETSSFEQGKRDTTERKSADDYFKANDVVSHSFKGDVSMAKRPETGSTYQTDSCCSTQQENTNRSFLSNEPERTPSHDGISEHDIQVQKLRERAMRMNEEHERDRRRMRADYTAKQAEALNRFKNMHRENRQQTRQEMHDVNSNVFTRFFRGLKKIVKSVTTPISRGLQSLFQGVQGRSNSCHGQTIF